MIYPCSGESIRRLIHLAEEDEEKYWADKKREGGSWGKLAVYLIEMKNVLRKMAEILYSCIGAMPVRSHRLIWPLDISR